MCEMPRLPTRNLGAHKLALVAIVMMPLLGLLAWWWFLVVPEENTYEKVLDQYGYRVLTPPSRFYGPGTFVTVETLKENHAVRLHLACNMDYNDLSAKWKSSETINSEFVTRVTSAFESSAAAAAILASVHTNGANARDIRVALQNINIITMPDEALIGVRSQYLRDSCEKAIIWNLNAGATVCQTEEVLEADISYSADSRTELGIGVKVGAREEPTLAGQIGSRTAKITESQGEDLILGVSLGYSKCFVLEKSGERLAKVSS
jgi:hypothetical protein